MPTIWEKMKKSIVQLISYKTNFYMALILKPRSSVSYYPIRHYLKCVQIKEKEFIDYYLYMDNYSKLIPS